MALNGLIKTLGLAGAAAAAWYFLDPSKGSGRRQRFVQGARDVYGNVGQEIGRIGEEIATGVTDTVSKVGEMTGLKTSPVSDGGSSPETAGLTNSAQATQRV